MKSTLIIIISILLGLGGYFYFTKDKVTKDTVVKEEPMDEKPVEEKPIPIESNHVYAGVLSAASDPGIETTLTLTDRGDGQGGSFSLVEKHLDEEDGTTESTGQWVIESKKLLDETELGMYVLTSEEDPDFITRYYEGIDESTIRALSSEGERIDSELSNELKLQ